MMIFVLSILLVGVQGTSGVLGSQLVNQISPQEISSDAISIEFTGLIVEMPFIAGAMSINNEGVEPGQLLVDRGSPSISNFDLRNTKELYPIQPIDGFDFIYGIGAISSTDIVIGGEVGAIQALRHIDPTTNTVIFEYDVPFIPGPITVNPATSEAYVVYNDPIEVYSQIHLLNIETGSLSLIAEFGHYINDIAFDVNNGLFWMIDDELIYQYDSGFALLNQYSFVDMVSPEELPLQAIAMDIEGSLWISGFVSPLAFEFFVGTINNAPNAYADSYSVQEDQQLNVPAPGLLGNDNDPEGVALTAYKYSNPSYGTVSVNTDGSFTYTPNADFSGSDSFRYRAYDGSKYSAITTVSISVQAVNDAPVAINDSYQAFMDNTLTKDTTNGVLANDYDVDSNSISVSVVVNPTYGSVNLYADGSFSYTPNAGYFGTDTFSYKPFDGELYGNQGNVTIEVQEKVNSLPIGRADAYEMEQDTTLVVSDFTAGLLGNDEDPDVDQTLSVILINGPINGNIGIAWDGTFEYTPHPGFYGVETLQYNLTDGHAIVGPINFTITVKQLDDNQNSDPTSEPTDDDPNDDTPVNTGPPELNLPISNLPVVVSLVFISLVATYRRKRLSSY